MRDDLLDAQASVDWAVAQIKVLHDQILQWQKRRPYVTFTEPDSEPGYDILKIRVKERLPAAVAAEAGAIINMIRSSLDILAVTLAERNGHISPKDVYFPIAGCVLEFIDPKDGAIKKIARLSKADRLAIEQLKPYQGGDDILYSLHQLDIMRKHRRLVSVTPRQQSMAVIRWGIHQPPELIYSGTFEDGAPLYRLPTKTDTQFQVSIAVTFTETPFARHRPVVDTLRAFAVRANQIISMFDN
jgi:hypothetical protein